MPVNLDKPKNWKPDIATSVDMYNDWFMRFAPKAFRDARVETTKSVEFALAATANLKDVQPQTLRNNPTILPTLRMSTCPPIAVDRLIGLAGVPAGFVKSIELDHRIPPKMKREDADVALQKIVAIIQRMVDPDIFTWLSKSQVPMETEVHRAATIVADRLCGSVANPIIRNAQEKRQLAAIKDWLERRNYRHISGSQVISFDSMRPGTFSFRLNIPVKQGIEDKKVNIPIDAVIMPATAKDGDMPILIEAKSAGDFTNTNKRRKEEATKMTQLRATFGHAVNFNLFLCGYFDTPYLGYEAGEGIDWIWEHRIDDLALLGL